MTSRAAQSSPKIWASSGQGVAGRLSCGGHRNILQQFRAVCVLQREASHDQQRQCHDLVWTLNIYSPEPTSCLIDNTLQDGYFLQVDVFMPGELESLQCQLRQKFAQESVLNKYFRYILNLNLNKFALL